MNLRILGTLRILPNIKEGKKISSCTRYLFIKITSVHSNLKVIAPAILTMVADLEFMKTKVKDLKKRWEIIQIHKGMETDDGSFDWDSAKEDKSDTCNEEPKYQMCCEESNETNDEVKRDLKYLKYSYHFDILYHHINLTFPYRASSFLLVSPTPMMIQL